MSNFIELKNTKASLNLEEFLYNKDISGRMFRKLLKSGNIKINGKSVKSKKIELKCGDVVFLFFPEERIDIKPQSIDIEVLYEDEDILAINKEPFMLVHPTTNIRDNTLSNGVANYFLKNHINNKVRVINRLDRDTSGVILFAKNSFGHQQIAMQLEKKTALKKYCALVEGILEIKEDLINEAIGKSQDGIRQCIRPDGLESITKYKVIEEYKNSSLLELQILTGRTHQIRVHLKYLGHPIVGDTLYNKECKEIKRQALHASSITFKKTRIDEMLEIKATLPDDILQLIEILKFQ